MRQHRLRKYNLNNILIQREGLRKSTQACSKLSTPCKNRVFHRERGVFCSSIEEYFYIKI